MIGHPSSYDCVSPFFLSFFFHALQSYVSGGGKFFLIF
jgi:hypothetical protein